MEKLGTNKNHSYKHNEQTRPTYTGIRKIWKNDKKNNKKYII
jgi:hypothetical protein